MKTLLTLLALFLAFGPTMAQTPVQLRSKKMDYSLHKLYKESDGSTEVTVFLRLKKANAKLPEGDFIKVNSKMGRLVTARVQLSALPGLVSHYQVDRVEFEGMHVPTIDSVKYHTNAWGVHKKWGPIDQAYLGEGVIVGIVDTGIDFEHAEFRDREDPTKCRILSVWSQWDETGTKPDSFSYGSIYTQQQFEDEINGVTEDALPITDYDPTKRGGQSHGTHVAGIAAGLNGMAPEADIIAVSVNWESAGIVDAVKYVIDQAILLNRPCVVNLSLGTLNNLHDGTGSSAEAYKALANLRPEGTTIVAAGGNSGSINIHWGGFEVEKEEKATYFYGEPVQLVFAISDTLMDKLSFSVTGLTGEFDYPNNTFSNLEEFRTSQWFTPAQSLKSDYTESLYFKDNVELGGTVTATCDSQYEGSRHHYFVIEIDDNADIDLRQAPPKANGIDLYRINVKGEGSFNSWLMPVSFVGDGSFSRSVTDPTDIGAPNVNNFVSPNNDYSIIAPALFKETISVGASVNKWSYLNTKGEQKPARWARNPNGSLGPFSSKGPTIDGRNVPEIVAPGENVFCAAPSYYDGWGDRVLDGTFVNSSGTSMASPAMAGAVALYFEKFPKATLADVRNDFLSNTTEDDFTDDFGPLPNNYWGYGKLDIYKVLSGGVFYSVDHANNPDLKVYPNPTSGQLTVNGTFKSLSLYSVRGEQLQQLPQGSTVDLSAYSDGIYLLQIETKDGLYHRRITVSH